MTPQGRFATLLGDTRVLFDGVAAPMVYALNGQVSAIVPYGVAGRNTTAVQVEYKGVKSNTVDVPVAASAPGLFTLDGRQAVAVLASGAVNGPAAPVERGGILVLYATGEGDTSPRPADGALANYGTLAEYPRPHLEVKVFVGGQQATILYAGAAPSLVAGVMQVNIQLAAGTPSGNAVPITLQVGGASSPSGVTVAVR